MTQTLEEFAKERYPHLKTQDEIEKAVAWLRMGYSQEYTDEQVIEAIKEIW